MSLNDLISKTAIIGENVKIGSGTKVWHFANLYGCKIGKECTIGSYVEIQSGAKLGDRVTISSHSFICDLVSIEDDVFIGHGVMTINDLNPPSMRKSGSKDYWKPTNIGEGVIIGSNATIFPVNIGKYAKIGAGAVVTKNVPDYGVVYGNPAKLIRIENNENSP
jgi:acetyltransferase-like isoleucine patch superfamily enzyme